MEVLKIVYFDTRSKNQQVIDQSTKWIEQLEVPFVTTFYFYNVPHIQLQSVVSGKYNSIITTFLNNDKTVLPKGTFAFAHQATIYKFILDNYGSQLWKLMKLIDEYNQEFNGVANHQYNKVHYGLKANGGFIT